MIFDQPHSSIEWRRVLQEVIEILFAPGLLGNTKQWKKSKIGMDDSWYLLELGAFHMDLQHCVVVVEFFFA